MSWISVRRLARTGFCAALLLLALGPMPTLATAPIAGPEDSVSLRGSVEMEATPAPKSTQPFPGNTINEVIDFLLQRILPDPPPPRRDTPVIDPDG